MLMGNEEKDFLIDCQTYLKKHLNIIIIGLGELVSAEEDSFPVNVTLTPSISEFGNTNNNCERTVKGLI